MKTVFLIFIFFSTFASADILGYWKLSSYIYDDQPLPLPNPDLDLKFVFYKNGFSVLHWSRKNEPGFCERKATFKIEGKTLHQKTVWINPKNDFSCASDPEMQPDSETFTNFRLEGNHLYLDLALDDKPFIYVFNFLPDEHDLRNGY